MFKYSNQIHNYTSPGKLVPLFMEWFQPSSVIDVGCGKGFFLSEFKRLGVEVAGIEGEWVGREALADGIDQEMITKADLNNAIETDQKYDLALCFEVAEHLHESSADNLVDLLSDLADTVLFSAAVPGQTGQGHINEQWPDYWIEKFAERGYTCYDFIRPEIWEIDEVSSWYKQNMLCFSKVDRSTPGKVCFDGRSLIHPQTFEAQKAYYEKIENGDRGSRFYLDVLRKKWLNRR